MHYKHPDWKTDDDTSIQDIQYQINYFTDLVAQYSFNIKSRKILAKILKNLKELLERCKDDYQQEHSTAYIEPS